MSRRGENIYKRKDGRYEGRYIRNYGSDGRAVYGSVYAYTYNEVRKKLSEHRAMPDKNGESSDMTLESLMALWMTGLDSVKETTLQVYRGHIDNYIIPRLGKVKLKRLTADTLQSFVSSLKVAPSTVKVIFSVLKSALKYAEEKGLIANIWSTVKLPKKARPEVEVLSPAQQKRLETALCEDNDIGVLICLYTGLRIGELCALKWSGVDLENSLIHVVGTQARIGGEVKILPPKSKTSSRTIPISEFLVDKLKKLPHNGEFVLSHNGSYVDVRSYRRRFKELLEAAGLPDIRFHALRHTFATRALEVGMDFKTLSEILGHSTVSITMDLYVHSLDEHKKNQMDKLFKIYSPSE